MASASSVERPESAAWLPILLVVAAALVLLAGFGGAISELARRWRDQEEYSHGFLIPAVTAWLLWTRRRALHASLGPPSLVGLGLIAFAILMNIVGELGAVFILSQLGILVALLGLTLAIGGYSLLRVTFIPIAYLIFAIPLPYFIDAKLTLQLQLVSSQLGVFFIELFRIPVYLEGNVIDMGDYKLQVVEACSGLRYLYPLFGFSFLAAYLFQAPFWQRAAVFLSSIPIAIGMNGFRIGLVGFLVDRWGIGMAEGALHFFEGWVIFLACAALLAGEISMLTRLSGRRFFDAFRLPDRIDASVKGKISQPLDLFQASACLVLLGVGALAVSLISSRTEVTPERTRFVAFPTRIAEWQGHVSSLDLATEQFLKADDYLLADYSKPDGKGVNLYVAYYGSQRKNESPHSPIVCLPGGGWIITQLERRTMDKGAFDNRPFNRVIIQNGRTRDLVYYWFDERGRTVADEYLAKLYLLEDSILKNRSDGALVRLTTEIKAESDEQADLRMQSFMQLAVPRLAQFLPSAAAAPSPRL
jgi:exosortase D (VPLPA-CTERM-specific)